MLDKIETGQGHLGVLVEHSKREGRGECGGYSEVSVW
jgi:hypothetical protein